MSFDNNFGFASLRDPVSWRGPVMVPDFSSGKRLETGYLDAGRFPGPGRPLGQDCAGGTADGLGITYRGAVLEEVFDPRGRP
jgi:hypothetical protein